MNLAAEVVKAALVTAGRARARLRKLSMSAKHIP
jgi:hypothetical protein